MLSTPQLPAVSQQSYTCITSTGWHAHPMLAGSCCCKQCHASYALQCLACAAFHSHTRSVPVCTGSQSIDAATSRNTSASVTCGFVLAPNADQIHPAGCGSAAAWQQSELCGACQSLLMAAWQACPVHLEGMFQYTVPDDLACGYLQDQHPICVNNM